jgi:plasmid maintenance system killer protein
MKTEIRKILADKTETLEDGRVVIVPDFSQLDDLVDDLNTLFSLYIVNQQRELLLDFMKKLDRVDHQDLQDGYYLELADRFLANNCG